VGVRRRRFVGRCWERLRFRRQWAEASKSARWNRLRASGTDHVCAVRKADPVRVISPTDLPRVFASARLLLHRAEGQRDALNDLWNSIHGTGAYDAEIVTVDDDSRELWCTFSIDADTRTALELAAAEFARLVKGALDAALFAAAAATCAPAAYNNPAEHAFPLCSEQSEFDELPNRGHFPGLRHDQIRAVGRLQPFRPADGGDFAGFYIAHLANLLEACENGKTLFASWADRASPDVRVPEGVQVKLVETDPAGPIESRKRLITYWIDQEDSSISTWANPNVSFDPIFNVQPWPRNPDDNLSRRSRALLLLTRRFIQGMERSVNYRQSEGTFKSLNELMPPGPTQVWLPVNFNNDEEAGVRQAIAESEQGIAIYKGDDGRLTYLQLDERSRVVGREIPAASTATLQPGQTHGIAVEDATRAAAGSWGLPDLVLQPAVIPKGSGIREVGDGTIFSGPRGIVLQVKAREIVGDTPARAESWLRKNASKGLSQARGTIKTLRNPAVTLTNLRGRDVTFSGTSIDWIPVIVLDHPAAPTGVFPPSDPGGPSVTMLRSDWEFLWTQLRSATAIVEYIHRVADEEPLELGAETHRYFDLAERDVRASPRPLPTWMGESGATTPGLPQLPPDPASSPDELGFLVFQRILEDVADSDFPGTERERLDVISMIDHVAVALRASLGRLLLRRLDSCSAADAGELRAEHRIMYLNDGNLHLSFSTMSTLTPYYSEVYKTWLLHRRQRFIQSSGASGPAWPWTVGVLLTPRLDGPRPWDTTMIATCGQPQYDLEEFDRLDAAFAAGAVETVA